MHRPTLLLGVALLAACTNEDDRAGALDPARSALAIKDRSVTPALVKNVMGGVTVNTLLSSDDTLKGSPDYVFGGTADGAGLLKNADGSYTYLVNNEDNFAVSRLTLDSTFAPVKGEYLLNSTAGNWRLCSATLATPAEHGFGPLFITAGESRNAISGDPSIHGVDPRGGLNQTTILYGLGHWLAENAVPLNKNAYPGKTVVVIGDDDSGAQGGQVGLYVANTVGDLANGAMYVLVRADSVIRERTMVAGQSYPVQFRLVPNHAQLTADQLNAKTVELKAVQFGRVEDVDYRKGAGNEREVYFNVTGQDSNGDNADNARSKYGRVYRLVLDAADPTKGVLSVVLDGDDRAGPAKTFQNVDNVLATTNYLYLEEDPNGYGNEQHNSYLYQYNLATKELKVVFEVDQRAGEAKFGASKPGDWENSGIIDVSDVVGREGTFLLGIQAHTWKGARYVNADRGTKATTFGEASQVLVLSGLPR